MTVVKSCTVHDCKHSKNGQCDLREISLAYSYGRSTDYTDVLVCEQYEYEYRK